MEAQCIAYTEDGIVCRRQAAHLDVQRGGMVCELHVSGDARDTDITADD